MGRSMIEERQRLLDIVQAKILKDIESYSKEHVGTNTNDSSRDYIRQLIMTTISEAQVSISLDREDLVEFIYDQIYGLGVIEPLLKDSLITDIMVEGLDVYEVKGGIRSKSPSFTRHDQVQTIIDRITARVGKRVDLANPVCDCELHDGSRCHIIIPPVSDQIYITIRKLKCMDLMIGDWIEEEAITKQEADFLKHGVQGRKNILISGGTGAGKTTLLNTLAKSIDSRHLIVTLEDTYELELPHDSIRRLLTRDESVEGIGRITFRMLIKNALRMNPDRLIMGEVRDESAYDLLHALNIGHRGSLSTIHANSVMDALWRLETLALSGGPGLALLPIKRQIARVIDVIVQMQGVEADRETVRERKIVDVAVLDSELSEDDLYVITSL